MVKYDMRGLFSSAPKEKEAAPAPELTLVQKRFYASEECQELRAVLQEMVDSDTFDTDSSYFGNDTRGFVKRHLQNLSIRNTTEFNGYISNLKLMTRKRSS